MTNKLTIKSRFYTTILKKKIMDPDQPSTLTAKFNIHIEKVLICKDKIIKLICTFNICTFSKFLF